MQDSKAPAITIKDAIAEAAADSAASAANESQSSKGSKKREEEAPELDDDDNEEDKEIEKRIVDVTEKLDAEMTAADVAAAIATTSASELGEEKKAAADIPIPPPKRSEDASGVKSSECETVAYDTLSVRLGVGGLMYLANAFVVALAKEPAVVFALPPVVWITIPQLKKDGVLACLEYEPSRKSSDVLGKKEPAVADVVRQLSDDEFAREYAKSEFAPEKWTPEDRPRVKIETEELMPTSLTAKVAVGGKPTPLTFSGIRALQFESAIAKIETTPLTKELLRPTEKPIAAQPSQGRQQSGKKKKVKLATSRFKTEVPNSDTQLYYNDIVNRAIETIRKTSGPNHNYFLISDLVVQAEMPSAPADNRIAMQVAVSYRGTPVQETYRVSQ